jgi:hypothetical protein
MTNRLFLIRSIEAGSRAADRELHKIFQIRSFSGYPAKLKPPIAVHFNSRDAVPSHACFVAFEAVTLDPFVIEVGEIRSYLFPVGIESLWFKNRERKTPYHRNLPFPSVNIMSTLY